MKQRQPRYAPQSPFQVGHMLCTEKGSSGTYFFGKKGLNNRYNIYHKISHTQFIIKAKQEKYLQRYTIQLKSLTSKAL